MKLNEDRPNVEIMGEMEEQSFSIKDTGAIFEILRNKMYSNNIKSICREISCNARDAHREVGKMDLPIEITLPTFLEGYYKIKDYGPGISPDRMSNIFIKYTASTKSGDNVQTGGFGLGAKTPFSYSDSFSIVTVVDGIRYNYNCFIDPTKVGKLTLSSQVPTDEPNGTEIIIPIQEKNFRDFITYTEESCRHWETRPTIKGGELRWQNDKKIVEGTGWAIAQSTDYYSKHSKAIIDGIEYPLDLDVIRNYADSKLIDSARGNLWMYFGIGELTLSATREQIHLDEKTKSVIRNRLNSIVQEVKQKVADKINSLSNLWDAHVYYQSSLKNSFSNLDFLGKIEWNGIEVYGGHMAMEVTVLHFEKGARTRRGYQTDANKLTRHVNRHLIFVDNSKVFINDLPLKDPTPRHVRKAFDDDATLKIVQVVVPSDTVTETILNTKYHLDKMQINKLSSITKASSRAYTPAANRLIIFKFDESSCSFRQVSYASVDEDPKFKVLCSLKKDSYTSNRSVILKNKSFLHCHLEHIQKIMAKFTNYNFYGVDESIPVERLDEEFPTMLDVNDFIEETVLANTTTNYLEIKLARNKASVLDEKLLRFTSEWKKYIKDPNSPVLKTLEVTQKIKALSMSSDDNLLFLYESFKGQFEQKDLDDYLSAHPEFNIEKMNEDLRKRYPLWISFNHYNFRDMLVHFAEYINLVDQKENFKCLISP